MDPKFITDAAGNRTGVVLSIKDYNWPMNELDKGRTVRLYDKAMAKGQTFQPLDEALPVIDKKEL